MTDKTSKTQRKRLPKGQRTHIRRLKQAARKAGIAYRQPSGVQTDIEQKTSI
ncbi:MAG: hypothetical protein JW963_06610 [Anaerolineales bacterium]|nr:hypothetical protein [Anaerolineales bacterium]